jgi:putative transposase
VVVAILTSLLLFLPTDLLKYFGLDIDPAGDFCTKQSERESHRGGHIEMPMQRYKPEQIVTVLRQIEVAVANGKSTPQACKEAGITVQTYYRWRKEYGGLKVEQAKRMKELEKENTRLKRLVAELSLEKQVLKDVAEGNF